MKLRRKKGAKRLWKDNVSPDEARKRRERIIIVVSIVVILFLTLFGNYLTQKNLDVGIGENLLLIALVDINIILLVLVIFLVIRNFVKLFYERKREQKAARLRTKLALGFASLTLFPTVIMFFAAILFFSGGMDKFFNVKVESSLEDSLDIAKTYYSSSTENVLDSAKEIGESAKRSNYLNKEDVTRLKRYVERERGVRGLDLVKVFSPRMEELASSVGKDIPEKSLERLNMSVFEQALKGESVATIQIVGYGDVIWALYPVKIGDTVESIVMTANFVPKSLMAKMREIETFLYEYKRNKLYKEPVVTSYLITLAVIALLVVFIASWLGFYLAKGITVPLSMLVDGTKKVAEGDLDVFVDVISKDEIGSLVDSFNNMTQDLKTQSRRLKRAYNELSESNLELEQRRRYMEIILRNVTAGVISIDKDGILTTVNKAAERMLGIKTSKVINRPYGEVLRPVHYKIVMELIEDLKGSKEGFVQQQVEIPLEDRTLTLMANMNDLVDEEGNFMGMVAVFDDITEIMKAQKMAAWREVAKRIAHEIKNPLTPIQLSAQRIRKKYLDSIDGDGEVLDECTRTIITQVDEMKSLVNEFSLFARMPSAKPKPNDLNKIVREAMSLYKDANKNITYRFRGDEEIPTMNLDREQIKRVLINLMENAVEAIDKEKGKKKAERKGKIEIETSFLKYLNVVRLTIADTGMGITSDGKNRLFEPYYSTKKNGTGLGLTIVNTIISDHRGFIKVMDNKPKGTKFIIDLPVSTS
jgi:two-component system nitrogen regulation sensor histidine kinase NtrY